MTFRKRFIRQEENAGVKKLPCGNIGDPEGWGHRCRKCAQLFNSPHTPKECMELYDPQTAHDNGMHSYKN